MLANRAIPPWRPMRRTQSADRAHTPREDEQRQTERRKEKEGQAVKEPSQSQRQSTSRFAVCVHQHTPTHTAHRKKLIFVPVLFLWPPLSSLLPFSPPPTLELNRISPIQNGHCLLSPAVLLPRSAQESGTTTGQPPPTTLFAPNWSSQVRPSPAQPT